MFVNLEQGDYEGEPFELLLIPCLAICLQHYPGFPRGGTKDSEEGS